MPTILNRTRLYAISLMLAFHALPGAAQTMQGDWPCKQVRVPEIAIGTVWTGSSIDVERKAWRDDATVADLVERIAPRRTPLEEAERLIEDFARAAGVNRKARLTLLFAGLYDRMNDERREVVVGLDRFGRRLKEIAGAARVDADALRDVQSKTPSDPDTVKKAAETLQWRLRVHEEQRKMTQFVCESPALIEQRFGALARMVEGAMQ
jgi:hypothetical protein